MNVNVRTMCKAAAFRAALAEKRAIAARLDAKGALKVAKGAEVMATDLALLPIGDDAGAETVQTTREADAWDAMEATREAKAKLSEKQFAVTRARQDVTSAIDNLRRQERSELNEEAEGEPIFTDALLAALADPDGTDNEFWK